MKTLFLLRHAKSSWSDPTIDDHERPLNERGRQAAPLIARHMAERGYVPDYILCSSARRTLETLELMRPLLPAGLPSDVEPDLYHVPAPTMLRQMRALPDASAAALVIAHNPGIEDLTDMMARPPEGRAERKAREKLMGGFPTAGLAVIEFDCPRWSDIDPGTGRLADLVKPRELEG